MPGLQGELQRQAATGQAEGKETRKGEGKVQGVGEMQGKGKNTAEDTADAPSNVLPTRVPKAQNIPEPAPGGNIANTQKRIDELSKEHERIARRTRTVEGDRSIQSPHPRLSSPPSGRQSHRLLTISNDV